MFMRNLLTFPDSLLKKINLDQSSVGSNVDIKLHLSVCKVDLLENTNAPSGTLTASHLDTLFPFWNQYFESDHVYN